MYALGQAISFSDSKYSFFKSDLITSVNDACPKSNPRDTFHKHRS